MRVVFLGAGETAVRTARILIERSVEVVIIELRRDVIDRLSETLDCGFLQGDGSKPAMLQEANPKQTDMLFCLTNNDQTNIIASLVGRSLGFKRVITSLADTEFEPICMELGLEDTIVPSSTISRYLADMVSGIDILELSTAIKGEARFFAFVLNDAELRTIDDLQLPSAAKVVCYYRGNEFHLAEPGSRLHPGDEVVVLTHSRNLTELRDRWEMKVVSSDDLRNSPAPPR